MYFLAVKKLRKHSGFVKTVHFQQWKGMQSSELGMWKGLPLIKKAYERGTFSVQNEV